MSKQPEIWFHEDDAYSELSANEYNKAAQTGPHKHKVRPYIELKPGAIVLSREELKAAFKEACYEAYCEGGCEDLEQLLFGEETKP